MPNAPDVVYVDNGLLFTGIDLTTAGIEIRHIQPGRPRSREKIEGVFAQLNRELQYRTPMSLDDLRLIIDDFIARHNAKI
jgi:transposase InsO family protein